MERERGDQRNGLDPLREPERWEGLVSSIVSAASSELERRRRTAGLVGVVLQWARPVLATAASVAVLVTAAALLGGGFSSATADEASFAGAVVPESYAAWLVAGYEPTVSELVVALEEVRR